MKKYLFSSVAFATTMAFVGCGGGSSSTSLTSSTIQGQFVDSAVKGITYQCSSGETGITDISGHYSCKTGDTVEFSLNGFILGTTSATELITPKTLFPNDTQAQLNLAQLLQTLDSDANPENGITIDVKSQEVQALNANVEVDFTQVDFDSLMASYLGKTLVGETSAKKHLDLTLKNIENGAGKVTQNSLVAIVNNSADTQCHRDISAEYQGYESYEAFVNAGGSFNVEYFASTTKICSEFSSAGNCIEQTIPKEYGGDGSCVMVVTFPENMFDSNDTKADNNTSSSIKLPEYQASYDIGEYTSIQNIGSDSYLLWNSYGMKFILLEGAQDIWKTTQSIYNLHILKVTEESVINEYDLFGSEKYAKNIDVVNVLDGTIKESIVFNYGQYIHIQSVNSDASVFVARFQTDNAYKIIGKDGTIMKSFEDTEYRYLTSDNSVILMYDYSGNIQAYDMNAELLWEKNFGLYNSYQLYDGDLYSWNVTNANSDLSLKKIDAASAELIHTSLFDTKYSGLEVEFSDSKVYVNLSGWNEQQYAIYEMQSIQLDNMSQIWSVANRNFTAINPVKEMVYTNYDEIRDSKSSEVITSDGIVSSTYSNMLLNKDGSFLLKSYDSSTKKYFYDIYK